MAKFLEDVQAFQGQLVAFEALICQANPSASALQQQFLQLQQPFQKQLWPAQAELTELAQPILLEMNRTLRLLGMDVAFLQAARQPQTMQQRQQQMRDRGRQLQQFCQGLLQLAAE